MATDGIDNFDRQYRIQFGQNNSKGVEIGECTKESPALHISFSCNKTEDKSKNNASIEIWNLNDEHLSELNKKGCKIILRAGYGNNLCEIFKGNVSFTKTVRDNADFKTTIEVVDCLENVRDNYVTLNYQGKVNWKTILDDTASKMGMGKIDYSYDATFTDLSNGFSYVGQAKDILTKGCKCCGLSWSIQNGVMQIKRIGGVMKQKGKLLSANTGLIGTPERVKESKGKDNEKKEEIGYDVTFFMDGSVNIGDLIKVETKRLKQALRVKSLQFSGDNTSGDWICKARLMEVK